MNEVFLQNLVQEWQEHFGNSGNDEFSEIRRQQFDNFVQQGLPTLKHEHWKYTNLTPLKAQRFHFASRPTTNNDLEQYFINEEHYRLVFIDGHFVAEVSVIPSQAIDWECSNLSARFTETKSYLAKTAHGNVFAYLNDGCLKDGAFIKVKQNTILDKPVHLLYLNSSNSNQSLTSLRNIIVAEPGADITIIEEHISQNDDVYLTNAMTQLHAEQDARIQYIKIQNQNRSSYHFGNLEITQRKNSKVHLHHINLGSQLAREDIHCHLSGVEAAIAMHGLYLPFKQQHHDVHTYVYHEADHTTSEEFYKGVVANKSRAVFNGKIVVSKHIKQAVANLQNKNLLLSAECDVNTKPELEIYSDDVKCRHGATVGQLDKEMLFYLQSRGIAKELAYQLLLTAFINDTLVTIPNQKIAAAIKNIITSYCEEHCYE